jgi:gliding motility-associated-like protein
VLELPIQVNQTPTVQISSFARCTKLVNFESVINMGATSAQLQSFYWLINGDSIPNVANPAVVVNLETGFYNGIFGIITSEGCNYTFDFQYFVDIAVDVESIQLPNVITPNGDGLNDFFLVNEIFDECFDYSIDFLNRWGHVVFTMTSNDNPFGGIDNTGLQLGEGVYFYNFKSEQKNAHGFLHLIRD